MGSNKVMLVINKFHHSHANEITSKSDPVCSRTMRGSGVCRVHGETSRASSLIFHEASHGTHTTTLQPICSWQGWLLYLGAVFQHPDSGQSPRSQTAAPILFCTQSERMPSNWHNSQVTFCNIGDRLYF